MKVVYLRWLDAPAIHGQWMDGDGADVRHEMHSAGIFVFENKQVITLATDFDGTQYRDVCSIPKSCITSRQDFEI